MNKENLIKHRVITCQYLSELAKDKGITNEQIAELTGYRRESVNRAMSGRFSTTLDMLINISNAIGYQVAFVDKSRAENISVGIEPKFLFSVDPKNNELYILHRHYPSCLIWVKQELPARFIIQDLYDEVPNEDDILGMDLIEEVKEYFRDHVAKHLDQN